MALISRVGGRWWLAAALAIGLSSLGAQTLNVRSDAGRVRVSAAKIQFLEGRQLDKLRNGASVSFAIQLTLLGESRTTVLTRSAGRFAVSFDLWEERFAVTRLGALRKNASHLSAAEAEAWCLDNLILPSAGLSPDSAFWVRLDVRPEEANESPPLGEDLGVTLARLVELFSRPPQLGETHKRTEAGPFRLKDLH
jgi:hypothetical protein